MKYELTYICAVSKMEARVTLTTQFKAQTEEQAKAIGDLEIPRIMPHLVYFKLIAIDIADKKITPSKQKARFQ